MPKNQISGLSELRGMEPNNQGTRVTSLILAQIDKANRHHNDLTVKKAVRISEIILRSDCVFNWGG